MVPSRGLSVQSLVSLHPVPVGGRHAEYTMRNKDQRWGGREGGRVSEIEIESERVGVREWE